MSRKVPLLPHLQEQFHAELNFPSISTEIPSRSSKKFWWQCPKHENHIWEATASARSAGAGCIYCANQAVLVGWNDLATFYPRVAAEWHPTLNGDLLPTMVTTTSGKIIWWSCNCGNSYQSRISHRTKRGHSCPLCSAKKVGKANSTPKVGKDAATLYPELIPQLHPTKNGMKQLSDYKPGSDELFWWLCAVCTHEWEASIYIRSKGFGCNVCASIEAGLKRATPEPGKSLGDLYPLLALQWHPTANTKTPYEVNPGSEYKATWVCPDDENHIWTTMVCLRTINKTGCAVCWRKSNVSRFEKEVEKLVASCGFTLEKSRRNLLGNGQEIDIYLPELFLGIECNGTYFHSSKFKEKDYHSIKHELANNSGIKLIQIWEDDWKEFPKIVEKEILRQINLVSKKRMPLTDFTVALVPDEVAMSFLEEYNPSSQRTLGSKNYVVWDTNEPVELLSVQVNNAVAKVIHHISSNYDKFYAQQLLSHVFNLYSLPIEITVDNTSVYHSLYQAIGCEQVKVVPPTSKMLHRVKRWTAEELPSHIDRTRLHEVWDAGTTLFRYRN